MKQQSNRIGVNRNTGEAKKHLSAINSKQEGDNYYSGSNKTGISHREVENRQLAWMIRFIGIKQPNYR